MIDEQVLVFYGLSLVIGLCVGSFINVIVYRLPRQLEAQWQRDSRDFLGIPAEEHPPAQHQFNIAFPASHCPKCGATLRAWHNIPLLSYVFLRGRCATCAEPISLQYPLVEAATGLAFVFVMMQFGLTAMGAYALLFSLLLLTLTAIDFRTQLLPDVLTYPLLWLGLIANTQGHFVDLQSAVFGAIAGYLSLWLIYWLFKLLTGKEGMGHGDFKLLAALGAWVGWQLLPLIVLLSSLVGAVIGVAMVLAMGRDKQLPMAFGPYLAIAGWIALFWGEDIVAAYLGYLS